MPTAVKVKFLGSGTVYISDLYGCSQYRKKVECHCGAISSECLCYVLRVMPVVTCVMVARTYMYHLSKVIINQCKQDDRYLHGSIGTGVWAPNQQTPYMDELF